MTRSASTSAWASAAVAIYSIGPATTPTLVRLTVVGLPSIVIDFRYRAFASDVAFENFPSDPPAVLVQTVSARPDMGALFDLPGQNVDTLLWSIGYTCFGDESAPWLQDGDRFKLTRWPNFTELAHEMEHIRMTAVLGGGFVSVAELARAAETDPADARRMINALSLMGAVTASPAELAPAAVIRATEPSRSLFRRLRDRLGV